MQLVVDSLLTNYQTSGTKKPTIVLLHGWGDSLATFATLQKDLAQTHTVVSVDLPGFGATQAPSDVWGLAEYAHFVASFLQKLKVKDLQAIVGHSNGAAVALYGLAHNILQADKVILLGAAGIRDQQKGRLLGLKVLAKTGKVATFWLPAAQKKRLRKKLYGAVGSDLLIVPHMQETFKKTVRQDLQPEAQQLNLPVLLVYGQEDTATPPVYGEIYHNLMSDSTFEIVGQAGHFVHQDQPTRVQKLIEEFLQ